jgi:hypothetical protein
VEAVLWHRFLVSVLSQRRPGFDSRPDHVVEETALAQVFSTYSCFLLSLSFYQCYILILIRLPSTLHNLRNSKRRQIKTLLSFILEVIFMFKRSVKRRVKFRNFWSATHFSQCLQSKHCRQITICLLTCNRRALRHSLHPHYKPNHVLQHSEPAGQLIDVAGWHCRGSR